ncbi:MAG TPA: ASKHA domain-containing protein [Candidatus Methanofastidiosa archaeon]|nr:ASKHA domain-containing protein [Candidatus Methanofastidiosa archaeon]HPR41398.1 ASKHA domain-containing protein [Candidatus Methanofastidiosa archaeon]
MAKVSVSPFDKSIDIESGKTVLDALNILGIPIEVICGGKGTCGKCKVIIEDQENVSPLSAMERKLLSDKELCEHYRLACLVAVNDDVSVFVPEFSLQRELRILANGQTVDVVLDPPVKKVNLLLPKPVLGDHISFEELVVSGLGLEGCGIDYMAIKNISETIKDSNFDIDVVFLNKNIISVMPHNNPGKIYGAAMDIGSTTVVIYLMDLQTGEVVDIESMLNPQVRYGEDVISRITYSIQYGIKDVHDIILEGVNSMLRTLCQRNDIDSNSVVEMTVVGNTAMHHIFLNIQPKSISLSPFTPTVKKSLDLKARDIGLMINPSANIHVLPVIAGFVGADTVGVLMATDMYHSDQVALAIDVGTNGELVLGNRDKMVSCSCAAGPALEGGEIKFGMRASPGAIEDVVINKYTLEPEYKTIKNKKPVGICGSGIIDVVAEMLKIGIINSSGRMVDLGSDRIRKDPSTGLLEYVLEWKENAGIDKDIVITAADVREVQLAKGAIYSGALILVERLGIGFEDLDKIYLAGAFGNYIDIENAVRMGLLPDIPLEKIKSVGNAAGEGAKLSLLSNLKRSEENKLSKVVSYIELASHDDFQNIFVNSLNFPEFKCPT